MDRVDAPWTEEQVERLRARQANPLLHPYTGPSGADLTPTPEGWREAPDGPVVQTWAHAADVAPDGTSAIELVEEVVVEHEELPSGEPEVKVGDWFWVRSHSEEDWVVNEDEEDEDDDGGEDVVSRPSRGRPKRESQWFGCVVLIGSNFYKIQGLTHNSYTRTVRVHFDEFADYCRREPHPQEVISRNIERARARSAQLLSRVKELTARLGVTPGHALGQGAETQAMVLIASNHAGDQYEKALVKAKETTLPDLFKKIRESNELMSSWMSAEVIPLQAAAGGLDRLVKNIDDRIMNVQLYAGLSEKIVRIKNGPPAEVGEKIRLMQRMCFMDEECLANYEHGGMAFDGLKAFDRWLARKDNLDRVLPFPRCIVGFRVRRKPKNRPPPRDLNQYFSMAEEAELDKKTFLYIRNGEQLYRLSTSIEFDEKLFPDVDHELAGGKLWAASGHFGTKELISDNEYQGMREEHARAMREWEEKMAGKKADKAAGKKVDPDGPWDWPPRDPTHGYSSYDKKNVYYDDITRNIQRKIQKHNRTVVIVQGLLDRSPVFRPHPGWQIWKPEGFNAGVHLVLDDSMALAAGDEPGFEAYRARLNALIKPGTVTVGQQRYWMRLEAKKESDRMDRNWRYDRHDYRPTLYQPVGDPGPGKLARVLRVAGDKCHYEWERKRKEESYWKSPVIRRTLAAPLGAVLNVDAYKPGDYKIFFNDPRTRSEYMKWAPLLLEAEEYHAGNRTVGPKDISPWEGGDRSYSEGDADV